MARNCAAHQYKQISEEQSEIENSRQIVHKDDSVLVIGSFFV